MPSTIEAAETQAGKAAICFLTIPRLWMRLGLSSQRPKPVGAIALRLGSRTPRCVPAEPEIRQRVTQGKAVDFEVVAVHRKAENTGAEVRTECVEGLHPQDINCVVHCLVCPVGWVVRQRDMPMKADDDTAIGLFFR